MRPVYVCLLAALWACGGAPETTAVVEHNPLEDAADAGSDSAPAADGGQSYSPCRQGDPITTHYPGPACTAATACAGQPGTSSEALLSPSSDPPPKASCTLVATGTSDELAGMYSGCILSQCVDAAHAGEVDCWCAALTLWCCQ